MRFFIEWALAVHRAVWFPMNWTLGLERPAIQLPVEFAPALASGADPPPLTLIKGGRGSCEIGCTTCAKHRPKTTTRRTKRATP